MLVTIIFVLILTVLISRAAKKSNTSSTVPLLVSLLVFIVFTQATRGIIRLKPGTWEIGILLGLMMYVAVAAAIYAGAIMWIKKKSSPPKE